MNMEKDIRDKPNIRSEDITGLNFIRDSGTYLFRKHYRQGLRSRIMEVLDSNDIRKEKKGEVVDGIRLFPRAKPLKMLRIFIIRFDGLEDALKEAKQFKIIARYLGSEIIAASDEFVVDYVRPGGREIVLCGLQEYVEGEILDPWGPLHVKHLAELFKCMEGSRDSGGDRPLEALVQKACTNADKLVGRLKKMILEGNCIPDLSGVGNLILTRKGNIKLVDINNISPVTFSTEISLDDKGYPVCDKSIEVISLMEKKLLQRPIQMNETIYRTFLDPQRMKKVRAIEKDFFTATSSEVR